MKTLSEYMEFAGDLRGISGHSTDYEMMSIACVTVEKASNAIRDLVFEIKRLESQTADRDHQ